MWLVIKIFVGLLCIYALVAGVAAWKQRDMMYFPETIRTAPAAAGLEGFEEQKIETPDGETILAWHRPAVVGGLTVIYFHGNGGSLRLRANKFTAFSKQGFGVLGVSYRGYGGSTGAPTEAGLLADGLAAYDWLAKRTEGPIAVYGESLGVAIAVPVAAKRPTHALILEAPSSSIVDVATRAYPFLPVEMLMMDQFHTDQEIPKVKAPVLMVHGRQDRVIPIDLGQKLFKLANEPKRFVEIEEGGHNDLWSHGAGDQVIEFLKGTMKPVL